MAVYAYTAANPTREGFTEHGTIVAASEDEALRKLKDLNLDSPHLRKLTGFESLLKRFGADVR